MPVVHTVRLWLAQASGHSKAASIWWPAGDLAADVKDEAAKSGAQQTLMALKLLRVGIAPRQGS